jgi:hypothetical protein
VAQVTTAGPVVNKYTDTGVDVSTLAKQDVAGGTSTTIVMTVVVPSGQVTGTPVSPTKPGTYWLSPDNVPGGNDGDAPPSNAPSQPQASSTGKHYHNGSRKHWRGRFDRYQ